MHSACCCYSACLWNTSVTCSDCGNPHFSYFLIFLMPLIVLKIIPGIFPLTLGMCEMYTSWWIGRTFFLSSAYYSFYRFKSFLLLQHLPIIWVISCCMSFILIWTAKVWTFSVWDTNTELTLFVGKTSENGVIIVKLMLFALVGRSIWWLMCANA